MWIQVKWVNTSLTISCLPSHLCAIIKVRLCLAKYWHVPLLVTLSTPPSDSIQIEPLSTVDLAWYTVGDTLMINFTVVTCAPTVTLKMSPSIAQQSIVTYTNTLSQSVQTFAVKVTPAIAGSYSITAQGLFFNGLTSLTYSTTQKLSITGNCCRVWMKPCVYSFLVQGLLGHL